MKMIDKKEKKKDFVFWVAHSVKCLSFHQEPKFEQKVFVNRSVMWQTVHELVERGYTVQ